MLSRIKTQNQRVFERYSEPIVRVQKDQALTPSMMMSLSEQGIPIRSELSADNFNDGDTHPLTSINPLFARGVDIVDIWNYQQSSRKNLVKANQVDLENYGK